MGTQYNGKSRVRVTHEYLHIENIGLFLSIFNQS